MTINKTTTIALQDVELFHELDFKPFTIVDDSDDMINIKVDKLFTYPKTDVTVSYSVEQAIAVAKAILEITGE